MFDTLKRKKEKINWLKEIKKKRTRRKKATLSSENTIWPRLRLKKELLKFICSTAYVAFGVSFRVNGWHAKKEKGKMNR